MAESALQTARAAYGLAVALVGPRVGTLVAGRPLSRGEAGIIRVLGARHVVQAVVAVAVPKLARPGVLVDASHALSLVGIAALSPRHRRLALADLPAASAFTLAQGTKGA